MLHVRRGKGCCSPLALKAVQDFRAIETESVMPCKHLLGRGGNRQCFQVSALTTEQIVEDL